MTQTSPLSAEAFALIQRAHEQFMDLDDDLWPLVQMEVRQMIGEDRWARLRSLFADYDATRSAAQTRIAELEAKLKNAENMRDLYHTINNMNPSCWFDQKSAENELLDVAHQTLLSLDAMAEAGVVSEGSYPTLEAVVRKYMDIRTSSENARAALRQSTGDSDAAS